jgi:anti-sigma factor RsiW
MSTAAERTNPEMDDNQLDLIAYALGEANKAERQAVEAHLAASAGAREEQEQLNFVLSALKSVPDEEIPRRIAFVSDPVFAPSLWQRFWGSAAQLGFAGAAMLAVAIMAHGYLTRPIPQAAPVANVAAVAQAPAVDVDAAVLKAVAQVEARQQALFEKRLQVAMQETEKRHNMEIRMMAASVSESLNLARKQMNRQYVSENNLMVGAPQQ